MNYINTNFLLFLTILLIFLFKFIKTDDLLNARCQSKCLADFEFKVQNKSQIKKQLKHQIVNLCKEDSQCSSCLLPCRDHPLDTSTCFKHACIDATSKESCQESCNFLVNGIKRRPGECPITIPVRLDECSAGCNKDGDCPGAEKCCTSGCSRICINPIKTDKKLLPIPEGITIQERKRKRSAVVRWVMKRLSKQHLATNSNLYVIQWRWGTRRDENSMTPWQTIMVKNKMYAILKHLLMPGRYYIFRVAAINQYGSLGFSKSSYPFKLSKEVRAPLSPKNFTVESMIYDDDTMKWIPKLSWIPPASDLPIKDYQLSWWKTTIEFANAYEQRTGIPIPEALHSNNKHSTDDNDDDYSSIDESIEKSSRSSTIIPSHSTKIQIYDGLDSENVYMIELFATVDSSEGELKGEPAVIFIKTNSTTMLNDAESVRYDLKIEENNNNNNDDNSNDNDNNDIKENIKRTRLLFNNKIHSITNPSMISTTSPTTTTTTTTTKIKDIEIIMTEIELDEPRFNLDIKTPYYENGKLKTSISWIDSSSCSSSLNVFAVRLTPKRCNKNDEIKLMTVTQCIIVIDTLNFDCEYEIEVDDVQTRKIISKAMFKTLSCENTPTVDRITSCNGNLIPKIKCNIFTSKNVICEWSIVNDSSIIGYRTILSSNKMTSKIGVASALSPKMEYNNLLPDTDYRFRLQPVTNQGLNPPIDYEFTTTVDDENVDESIDESVDGDVDENQIDKIYSRRLDKYPILELPLESSSNILSIKYSTYLISTVLILLVFRIN